MRNGLHQRCVRAPAFLGAHAFLRPPITPPGPTHQTPPTRPQQPQDNIGNFLKSLDVYTESSSSTNASSAATSGAAAATSLAAYDLAAYRDLQCASGYYGNLCGRCRHGYGRRSSGACAKCARWVKCVGWVRVWVWACC